MKAALLADRGVVKVTGLDARKFLDGLVTADLDELSPQQARFAALLTPQGKIIVDFIVAEAAESDGGGLFLDCPRALAPALAERLRFYKLRAKVAVEDLSETLCVLAIWDGAAAAELALVYGDPRLAALGRRAILPSSSAADAIAALGAEPAPAEAYDAHRIALGVPRGGVDFAYGDAFPHEADMDQLGGVDFDKGCYVGQEVVSRMQHRGTARTRIVGVTYADFPPEPGAPVLSGEKQVGTMGSGVEGRGLAMLRLDRIADAAAAGTPLVAGGVELRPIKPDWARFEMAAPAA
jgi:tRNA-modifying protein YgfZ